jgi:aspartate/methionine/tyrosine aminotransferase
MRKSEFFSAKLPAHIQFTQSLNCFIEGSLSQSTAQSLSLGELCQLSGNDCNLFEDIELSYASLKGDVELRQSIAKFHQKLNHHQSHLDESNVLTFCGAQEALASIYQCLLEVGDEIVVITPNYPSLTNMAEDLGCIVKTIDVSPVNNWQINIDSFRLKMTNKTKVIVINSPHNPTGSVIDSDLAEEILSLAKEYDCYLLSDDVSHASNYNCLALSHRFLDYEKSLVVSVMSKSFGLAGIRIGWVMSKSEVLLSQLLAIKSVSSICCSVIDEAAAKIAFKHCDEIIEQNNQLIKKNIKIFQQFVNEHKDLFQWHPPKAGIMAVVEVKNGIPIEVWAKELANQAGILMLPTSLFGLSGNYFRLGLGQNNFKYLLLKLSQFILKT